MQNLEAEPAESWEIPKHRFYGFHWTKKITQAFTLYENNFNRAQNSSLTKA